MTPQEILKTEQDIIAALRKVFDPEIPVNVYDLGLIYEIDFAPSGEVSGAGEADKPSGLARITMTLTAPNCPMADMLVEDVKHAVGKIEGVSEVDLTLTFEPPWDKSMLSDEAKLELGLL